MCGYCVSGFDSVALPFHFVWLLLVVTDGFFLCFLFI
jgi:hypothetical protein